MSFYRFVTGGSQAIIAISMFSIGAILSETSDSFINTLTVVENQIKKSTKILEQIQEDRKKRWF